MLRAAAELLPDDSAAEVCRFAWSEFKNGSRHWLVARIAAQSAYRVPGLLHDDWDAVLRLSAHEPIEGPFWWELPIEVGRRWIQEARAASTSAAGLPGLPLEMSGVVEFQGAARDLSGSRDEPWAAIGREGLSGLELGSGRAAWRAWTPPPFQCAAPALAAGRIHKGRAPPPASTSHLEEWERAGNGAYGRSPGRAMWNMQLPDAALAGTGAGVDRSVHPLEGDARHMSGLPRQRRVWLVPRRSRVFPPRYTGPSQRP